MKRISLIAVTVLMVLLSGCPIDPNPGEGTLRLEIGSSPRIIWHPDVPLDIESYRIQFSGPGDRKYTVEQELGELVMDALVPGEWEITISGWESWDNEKGEVSGRQIAYLKKNQSDERSISVMIFRGQVTEASGVMVPFSDGTGDLSVTVDWTAIKDYKEARLIYENPELHLQVKSINNHFDSYDNHTGTDTVSLKISKDGAASIDGPDRTLTDGSLDPITVTGAVNSAEVVIQGLPAGWYEVTAKLTSTNDTYEEYDAENRRRYWQRMSYARIADDPDDEDNIVTSGAFVIDSERMFEVGSSDITIEDLMDPLTVAFTSPAGTTHYLVEPEDEGGTVEVIFTVSDSFDTYLWYLNGSLLDADVYNTNSIELTFEHTGKNTVTVSVIKDGNWGSASMEVTIEE